MTAGLAARLRGLAMARLVRAKLLADGGAVVRAAPLPPLPLPPPLAPAVGEGAAVAGAPVCEALALVASCSAAPDEAEGG